MNFKDDGHWFREGMADYITHNLIDYDDKYFGNDTDDDLRQDFEHKHDKRHFVREFSRDDRDYDINSLIDWNDHMKPAKTDYAVYESTMHYLSVKYGDDKVKELFNMLGETGRFDHSLETIFGKTEEQLTKEWKRYLNIK